MKFATDIECLSLNDLRSGFKTIEIVLGDDVDGKLYENVMMFDHD